MKKRAYLQVSVLADSNGDIRLLLVKCRAIHSNSWLVRLEDTYIILDHCHCHCCYFLVFVPVYHNHVSHLEYVFYGHAGHLDDNEVNIPVGKLFGRLREQECPSEEMVEF